MKLSFLFLAFGITCFSAISEIKTVNPGDDLNAILKSAQGGDTVLIKPGVYASVSLSDKKFPESQPLVVRSVGTEPVFIKGTTISKGSALEVNNCSYIVFEGLTYTNARWGIYIKNSAHIVIRNNEILETGQEGCHIGRSSRHIDIIENEIHHTGRFNSKWGEGIYVGSGSYSGINFPDNCEYIWIEGNHIYETGHGEAINIKSECFHVTVRNNRIHDIHPGTSEQYNQAAITVEGGDNSLKHNYRLNEKRDVWIENNTIQNVSGGYSDWNNGIMFFGTGVYILNNTINNCTDRGIYGNNWRSLGLENYVYGNKISNCGTAEIIHPELKIRKTGPGKNPHSPQKWYSNL